MDPRPRGSQLTIGGASADVTGTVSRGPMIDRAAVTRVARPADGDLMPELAPVGHGVYSARHTQGGKVDDALLVDARKSAQSLAEAGLASSGPSCDNRGCHARRQQPPHRRSRNLQPRLHRPYVVGDPIAAFAFQVTYGVYRRRSADTWRHALQSAAACAASRWRRAGPVTGKCSDQSELGRDQDDDARRSDLLNWR